MGYNTLIFDLGNVLVSFSLEKMFSQIASLSGLPEKHIQEIMIEKRLGSQYERGLLSNEEIYAIIKEKAPNAFELTELLHASSSIFSPRVEMETLIHTLKKKGYHLLLLSNTIEPHFNHIQTHYPFLESFDHHILSYEVGFIKPESAIFKIALKKAACPPSECFFIDDIIENVQAAEKLGIHGHHFTTPAHLMDDLIQTGIL